MKDGAAAGTVDGWVWAVVEALQAEGRAVIDDWLDSMEAGNLSPRTVRRRALTMRRFLAAHPEVLDVTPRQIEQWLNSLNVSAQSRAYYLADLSSFYRWAVNNDHTTRNPTERVQRPKKPNYLPRPIASEDLWRAIDTAEPRTRKMIVLAAYGGLRVSEVAALKGSDVDWEAGVMRVRGKGNKLRTVQLNPELREVLDGVNGAPVIEADGGGHLDGQSVTRAISRHLRELGIDDKPHSLRHWYGTMMYRQCGDIRAVQKSLGHSSPATTAVYAEPDDEVARRAANNLPKRPSARYFPPDGNVTDERRADG